MEQPPPPPPLGFGEGRTEASFAWQSLGPGPVALGAWLTVSDSRTCQYQRLMTAAALVRHGGYATYHTDTDSLCVCVCLCVCLHAYVVCWRQFESYLHRSHYWLIFNSHILTFLQKNDNNDERLKTLLVDISDGKFVTDCRWLESQKKKSFVSARVSPQPDLNCPCGVRESRVLPLSPPQSSIYHSPQWRHGGAATLRFKVNPFKRLGLCYLVRSMCSVTTGSSGNLAGRETVTERLIDFWKVVGENLGYSECFFVFFFQ